MSTVIVIIHIIVAIALILIVLLQTGKGADMGAAFGGGSSQTLFGSGGASTFLSRLTTIAAIVFMLTSLGLAYVTSHKVSKSIMSEMPEAVPGQGDTAAPAVPAEETIPDGAVEVEETAVEIPATTETEGAGAEGGAVQPEATSPAEGAGEETAKSGDQG